MQVDDDEIQAYVTPSEVENVAIDRAENYSTLTMAQLASESGISNFSNFFVNDPNSPIQWPFAVGVPISYGFGMRDGTMHEGADFTPGEGAPIQAIADGVVRESTDSGGAFGVHIVIDHVIDGQLVSSSYSHMLYGSRQVEVGDQRHRRHDRRAHRQHRAARSEPTRTSRCWRTARRRSTRSRGCASTPAADLDSGGCRCSGILF